MTYNVVKLVIILLLFVATIVGLALSAVDTTLGTALLTGLVAYVIGNANVTGISSVVEKNKE